jgi:thiamine-phosphate pyrophosphorylase
MAADIAEPQAGDLGLLLRVARRLRFAARIAPRARRRLPLLLFLTDPDRAPEPWRAAERLPRGSAVVFRAFGRPDAIPAGLKLKAVAHRRGLRLLLGADPALAAAIGADGVHLPQRLAHRAGALRRAHPGWIVTAAAHSRPAVLAAARAGACAVLVSPVFESRSPSAGRPLETARLAALVRASGVPVYALGGVDAKSARRLIGTGAAGLAAVGAFLRT